MDPCHPNHPEDSFLAMDNATTPAHAVGFRYACLAAHHLLWMLLSLTDWVLSRTLSCSWSSKLPTLPVTSSELGNPAHTMSPKDTSTSVYYVGLGDPWAMKTTLFCESRTYIAILQIEPASTVAQPSRCARNDIYAPHGAASTSS
ncbi:hypothetical protein T440DRAFT_78472 [Plenodomus tracheiphilus IPT5]|uniref:Uncharacterized protein n=1 Tax=Plenodomus tracheiphilus IPT5 TaxID=1408161 RepID=A0A6A7B6Z3_9PLEO|nr:hypothetical protein T440DRAFT_78472 [Plenodomus tracheiphilus IPT5]